MRNGLILQKSVVKYDSIFIMILFFMSILLHQSNILLGINISLADVFCIMLFGILVYNNDLLIPKVSLFLFLFISLVVIITATFFVPLVLNYNPNPIRIITEYIKLLVLFLYFIIGYNLAVNQLINRTLKWYSFFGLVVAGVGIVFTLSGISLFSNVLFFANIRYRGLMIDPNYYAVLQITAYAYISRIKSISKIFKIFAFLLTVLAVLISGSKTGIITLSIYLSFRLLEYILKENKKVIVILTLSMIVCVSSVFMLSSSSLWTEVLQGLSERIPAFDRVEYLFTNFNDAISNGGSGRDTTWRVAIGVIQMSPVVGVGIGTFTNIASEFFQYNNLAHNTFLQLLAEWGIPLTVFLFILIFGAIIKVTFSKVHYSSTILILRDILLILLSGSMAISLNNSRLLWLVLGAIVFLSNRKE